MIIPQMSYQEIMSEIREDMAYVFSISDKKDAKVKKIVQKSSVFPCKIHSFVTSKNKNRWLLMWEALNRKGFGDNALFTFACIVDTPKGKHVIMPTICRNRQMQFIFIPHFFQRFAQRMNLDLKGEDLIRRFLQYNSNFSIETKLEHIEETKYAVRATATSSEGVALGYRVANEDGFLFKTFITYDMSKGEQTDAFAEIEERRLEHYNDFVNNYMTVEQFNKQ